MKKLLLISLLLLVSAVLTAQTSWKRLNAGSVESGIPGDPTLRFGTPTGFGANGDDVISASNEGVWKLNNNALGTSTLLTTFPPGSKVNGILKCSDGLIRIVGLFIISPTQTYAVMVSDASDPTSFAVQTNTLSTYQFGAHPAQRGCITLAEFSYGSPAQAGFIYYGGDLLTLNGVSVPSTVAFMNLAGAVTDLPQGKPNTEDRIVPTYPVTNPRILFMAKRINTFSTNGELLIGGRYQTLGGLTYHGLASYNNTTSTLTDFNITAPAGNQAVTQYNAVLGKEYILWKSDNLATNGGITSSGLLEINASNAVVGVSGGIPNLQSNCSTNFGGKTWIGGSRYNSALPANTYSYDGTTFTDASGSSPNDLDNSGPETLYDLFSTPNFIYATGNFQIASGDVANYIAVRRLAPPLALLFKSFRGELQNSSTKIYFEMYSDASVEIQQSNDGIRFTAVTNISVMKNVLTTVSLPNLNSNVIYVRLKSGNELSQTIVLRKSDKEIIKVFKSGNSLVVTTPTKANYMIVDVSGRSLQRGTVEKGTSFLVIPVTIRGLVFVKIQTNTDEQTSRIIF